MAYDEDLAQRIRELIYGEPDLTEKKMFGGLGFLIGGNMAVVASGQGGVLVRVDAATSEEIVATTPADFMERRGRPLRGWLRVARADVRTKRELARWVRLGTNYALAPRQGQPPTEVDKDLAGNLRRTSPPCPRRPKTRRVGATIGKELVAGPAAG